MKGSKKIKYHNEDLELARFARILGNPVRIALLRRLSSLKSCCFNLISDDLSLAYSTDEDGNTSGTLLSKLQAFFLIMAVVSGILMMIKFDLIYQIVRVAYTVFEISVVLSVLISKVYFINDQFSILKTDALE